MVNSAHIQSGALNVKSFPLAQEGGLSTVTLQKSEGATAMCRLVCLAAACAPRARRLMWERP